MMTAPTCPSRLHVTAAVTDGMTPELAEHLEGCKSCRVQLEEESALHARAQALPEREPSIESARRVRSALLSEPVVAAGRNTWALAAAAVLLLSLGAATVALRARHGGASRAVEPVVVRAPVPTVIGPPPVLAVAPAHRKGTVHARAGARMLELGGPGDEVVRLEEGGVTVEVEKLARAERFRVVTGDGEVEVRGTAFDVDVVHDHLRAVRVWHGVVEVRPANAALVVLHAGEHWSAVPARSSAVVAPDEDAFNEGWSALKSGDFSQASLHFRKVLARGGSPLEEDALYWNAVALQRAGRAPESLAAWEELLARKGDSERAAEAHAFAGWILVARGDCPSARKHFTAVKPGAAPRVSESAREGLQRCEGK